MNIFLHEIKTYSKSTVYWILGLSLFIILMMSLYQGFASDAQTTKDMLNNLPDSILKGFEINPEIFLSILGFYSFAFLYIVLVGSIQALNLGLSMLSKETREKTADFLLTKPVTREKIITAKMFAALTLIVVTNIVFILISVIMMNIVKTSSYSFQTYFLISITLLFVQLLFLSFGFVLSVIIRKIKSIVSISLPIVFGFFIISMLGSIIGDKAVSYLTPFKYFDRNYILEHGSFEISYIIIEVILITISVFFTYYIYTKKDIHAI